MKPPDRVLTLLLQSVQLDIVISETRGPPRGLKSKRSKMAASASAHLRDDEVLLRKSRTTEEVLVDFDSKSTDDTGEDENLFAAQPSPNLTQRKNGHRTTAVPESCVSVSQSFQTGSIGKRRRPATVPATPVDHFETSDLTDLQYVETLVDAALRLSVCNNLRGSVAGLKTRASSFKQSLAGVAPALWRPGYLAVSDVLHSRDSYLLTGS